jgi:hypothetical protein
MQEPSFSTPPARRPPPRGEGIEPRGATGKRCGEGRRRRRRRRRRSLLTVGKRLPIDPRRLKRRKDTLQPTKPSTGRRRPREGCAGGARGCRRATASPPRPGPPYSALPPADLRDAPGGEDEERRASSAPDGRARTGSAGEIGDAAQKQSPATTVPRRFFGPRSSREPQAGRGAAAGRGKPRRLARSRGAVGRRAAERTQRLEPPRGRQRRAPSLYWQPAWWTRERRYCIVPAARRGTEFVRLRRHVAAGPRRGGRLSPARSSPRGPAHLPPPPASPMSQPDEPSFDRPVSRRNPRTRGFPRMNAVVLSIMYEPCNRE